VTGLSGAKDLGITAVVK